MDSYKSEDNIRISHHSPKFKLIYRKDKSLEEYRRKLKERLEFESNHPIKAFFMDLFGILKPVEKEPSEWVIEREEVL